VTTNPLHTATIAGRPLRFFRTPLNDGRPDMPWVAIDELGRCAGLNRADRRIYQTLFHQTRAFKEMIQTIATRDGPVTIVPHALAQLTLGAMIDRGRASASALDDYTKAFAAAAVLIPGPFPSPEAATEWMNAAANRWIPLAKPISVAELFPNVSGVTMSEKEDEREYLLNEGQTLFLTMCACGDENAKGAKDICHDMVKIVMAWRRGKLLPRWETPHLNALLKLGFERPDAPA
jgi:hypothetical protein